MQTFLPYPKMSQTAKVLDMRRLGKQRVETLQIMTALIEPGLGWANHPATKMWFGYEWALLHYQKAIVEEWKSRGYKDTCFEKTFDLFFSIPHGPHEGNVLPPWYGNRAFHLAHQSNLIRKDRTHYGLLFPGVPDNLPYIWPI